MNGRHVADSRRIHEYPDLEATHGEDPARFLESNELMATARIGGIRDADLLDAYETVAEEITTGSYQSVILEAIAERKAELGLETDELPAGPTPDTSTDPVAATDGGTVTKTPSEPEGSDVDTLHPDADGLEPGQVLVVTREDKTEYVWPQTDAADEPFILRLFDADGDQELELTLSQRDLFSRTHDQDSEKRPVSEIDKPAPRNAAMNGGDA